VRARDREPLADQPLGRDVGLRDEVGRRALGRDPPTVGAQEPIAQELPGLARDRLRQREIF
jgi:hypothetical protein